MISNFNYRQMDFHDRNFAGGSVFWDPSWPYCPGCFGSWNSSKLCGLFSDDDIDDGNGNGSPS